jgi:Na+/proline symporter
MMVIYAVFNKLGYSGADQISIQRYLSTRNERDAARSLVWGAVLSVPVVFLLFVTGLGLYYFYAMYPDKALPNMAGDHALAHFIATELPPGIGGIMLAAILAAVMSTVDSGLNSLATCTVTDFYARLWRPDAGPRQKLRAAQYATLVWGGISLLSAAAIVWLFGATGTRNPLVVVANVTLGFFTGILLGVFLLGTLTRRANGPGVLLGALVGLTTALAVTAPNYFVRLEPGTPRLSFLWINMIGCLATIITGYVFSFLFARPAADKLRGFTHWDPPTAGE